MRNPHVLTNVPVVLSTWSGRAGDIETGIVCLSLVQKSRRTMKSAFRSNARAGLRRRQLSAPAEVETFESRLLLTTVPSILTPTGSVAAEAIVDDQPSTVDISWTAVDNAVSYQLWVSSMESFQRIDVPELNDPIQGTQTSVPVTSLAQGRLRIWVRATLDDGSVSAWSPSHDFRLNVTPSVTGPVGEGARNLTPDAHPEIQWAAADGSPNFQIWLTDVSDGVVRRYTVPNLTPQLDDNGDPVLDFRGDTIPEEIRSYRIEDESLPIGRYRVWVRAANPTGGNTAWSDSYTFDVGPAPQNLSPAAPTFFDSPQLTWSPVAGATSYEVFFTNRSVSTGTPAPPVRTTVDTTSWQVPTALRTGEYSFWVRAIRSSEDGPTVYGAWSDESQFRTLVPPNVIGPVADQGYVTALRPTIEWSPIHGTATYEVLVHKFDSKPPFLSTLNSSTSLTFEHDLPVGDYTVWVRAIDTRGNFSSWSDPFYFRTTGGRPVVTSPEPGQTVDFPVFSWVGRDDAVSYTIWVAQLEGDFTYINVDGIQDTVYRPIDETQPNATPLPDGNYRVWVRAVLADGSTSLWSQPVDFVGGVVVSNESSDSPLESLAVNLEVAVAPESLQTDTYPRPDNNVPADSDAMDQAYAAVAPPTESPDEFHGIATPSQPALDASTGAVLPAELLTKLAEQCVDAEWWQQTEQAHS